MRPRADEAPVPSVLGAERLAGRDEHSASPARSLPPRELRRAVEHRQRPLLPALRELRGGAADEPHQRPGEVGLVVEPEPVHHLRDRLALTEPQRRLAGPGDLPDQAPGSARSWPRRAAAPCGPRPPGPRRPAPRPPSRPAPRPAPPPAAARTSPRSEE